MAAEREENQSEQYVTNSMKLLYYDLMEWVNNTFKPIIARPNIIIESDSKYMAIRVGDIVYSSLDASSPHKPLIDEMHGFLIEVLCNIFNLENAERVNIRAYEHYFTVAIPGYFTELDMDLMPDDERTPIATPLDSEDDDISDENGSHLPHKSVGENDGDDEGGASVSGSGSYASVGAYSGNEEDDGQVFSDDDSDGSGPYEQPGEYSDSEEELPERPSLPNISALGENGVEEITEF